MRLGQPGVQWEYPRLGAEAEEREQERQRRPLRLKVRGAQRIERVVAAPAVQHAEAQEDRERPDVRDQQVEKTRGAHRRLLVVGHDEEVRRQRHRLPGQHEQIRVVCEQHEGHAREKHVVLAGDERQTSRGLRAEIACRVDGDPGRDRAEQQQKEAGERIGPKVERQIGQPERKR